MYDTSGHLISRENFFRSCTEPQKDRCHLTIWTYFIKQYLFKFKIHLDMKDMLQIMLVILVLLWYTFLVPSLKNTAFKNIFPCVVNQWFPIDWLQSIQSIIINNNPLIVIDWCNQSIKIDTHTRSLNCYWLPLISIENHWLIIHYATFWRMLAWACFIGPGHIYTSRVIR